MHWANKVSQVLPTKLFILNYLASPALNTCKQGKNSGMAWKTEEKYILQMAGKKSQIKQLKS